MIFKLQKAHLVVKELATNIKGVAIRIVPQV